MQLRTDLAIEKLTETSVIPEGIRQETQEQDGVRLVKILVETDRGARLLGRPCGTYVTAELPALSDNDEHAEARARFIGGALRDLLPPQGTVLVAGLGNEAITPDALGPRAARMVLATRHIEGEFARSTGLSDLRPAAVITPGVLGQTGVESSETVRGVCDIVRPSAVVVIDALAARSVARLGCTVQLCDTGVAPGSGVGNDRAPLNRHTLGVPVIGVGVPTVVDARTVAVELTGREDAAERMTPRGEQMMVTPREIDLIIHRAARLVAMAINAALQPSYSPLSLVAAAL